MNSLMSRTAMAAAVFYAAPTRVQEEGGPAIYRLALRSSPMVAVGGISFWLYSIEPFSMLAFLAFAVAVLVWRLVRD